MTLQIGIVLGILLVSLALFITEKLRMDVVALLVLSTLALTGLVTPAEALAGFSNPAVVTVWAMFILSAGLTQAGVAEAIGRPMLRLAGKSEVQAIVVIMLIAGILSAFMNNIGVAAMLLPVVITIAKKTGHPPSRLLMPLAFGSLLGGLTTLIGTPPNLVASQALVDSGHSGFALFDFTPVGLCAMLGGIVFVAVAGRRILPKHTPIDQGGSPRETEFLAHYGLDERRFELEVPRGSPFAGRALVETGLSSLLGIQVFAVRRVGRTELGPGGDFQLQGGDILQVQGRIENVHELAGWQALEMASGEEMLVLLSSEQLGNAEVGFAASSRLIGLSARECDFHKRFGVTILGIRRDGVLCRDAIADTCFQADDRLLLEGTLPALDALREEEDFDDYRLLTTDKLSGIYTANDRLIELQVPAGSALDGMPIEQSHLKEGLGLIIIGIARTGRKILRPASDEKLHAGDRLLLHGSVEGLTTLRGLQSLKPVEGPAAAGTLATTSPAMGFAEATLAPRSSLVGKTLKEIAFRNRFGLEVAAIWRAGRAYRSHLRNMKLQFGDAILISGPREKLRDFEKDADFLVLSMPVEAPSPETRRKLLRAILIMAAVIVPVILGWQPIYITAVAGAAVMVATGCLSMREAYRAIEWQAVFLIAGMIPLGTALQTTGAAKLIGGAAASALAPLGDWSLVAGLYLVTAVFTTMMPTTALVLLMSPIAIQAAIETGMSPQSVMMAIAMAGSAGFTAPISHPVNLLVMGPAGYRFVDYLRLGVPLAIFVMICVMPAIAIFWPLR